VIIVTTADRVDSITYRSWAPTAVIAGENEDYVGRHRTTGRRAMSMRAMFHIARHRRH
jgi:hypothetical protein